jgi:diamine N-acetyltransferase
LTGAVAQYPAQIMGIEYNGLYVGNIGLHIGADVYRKSAELGYLLDEKYWNRGIMTRAVHQMCDYGFRELDIVRIYAGVFEYNLSSQRLLEKCGFQKEAVFRKAVFKMGEIWDEIRYSKIILMPQLQIQKASINDVSVLKKIGRQTFYETFHDTNTEDNLRKYLDESFADEKLKEELSNPLSWFYFAAIEDKVVGYLKVNFGQAQTEFRHDGWFEVERIYVVQEFWGRSIGQALLDFAIALASDLECSCVWLGVWEKNYRALRFYERNGFLPFDKHIFQMGNDPQWDLLMKKMI